MFLMLHEDDVQFLVCDNPGFPPCLTGDADRKENPGVIMASLAVSNKPYLMIGPGKGNTCLPNTMFVCIAAVA